MTSRTDIAALGAEAFAPAAMLPSAAMAEFIQRSSRETMTIGALLEQSPPSARDTLILLIALLAVVPGASLPAGLALMVLCLPMIGGGRVRLPQGLAARPLPIRSLSQIFNRVLPLLRWQERIFSRSGAGHVAAVKPFVAVLLLALSATLLVPLPLSNVAPALAIAMIALACLETSVTLLAVSALTGLLSLALTGSVIWAALGGARLLFG